MGIIERIMDALGPSEPEADEVEFLDAEAEELEVEEYDPSLDGDQRELEAEHRGDSLA